MSADENPTISESYPVGPGAGGEDIGSDVSSIEEASRSLTETRESERETTSGERPIDIVDFRDEHGQPHPDRSALSLRQASEARADHRNRVVADREERSTWQAASDIDTIRYNRGELPGQPATAPAPQYAPQQHQDGLPAPGGGSYAMPSREQILASGPNIERYYADNSQYLARLEVRIGEEAAAGHDLAELYQRRNIAIQHVNHALYLARVHQSVGPPWNLDPRIAIPLAEGSVQQHLAGVLAEYDRQYMEAARYAARIAEDAYLRSQTNLVAMFPELRSALGDMQKLGLAINVIGRRDPRRAETIRQWLAYMEKTYADWKGLHWQAQHRHDQILKAWVAQEDELFVAMRPEMKSEAYAVQHGAEVLRYLQSLGCTKAEVAAAWHDPRSGFHNHVLQAALSDAAKYWRATNNVSSRKANPVRSYMKPGVNVSGEIPGRARPAMPGEMNGNAGLRAAADILTARRQGKR